MKDKKIWNVSGWLDCMDYATMKEPNYQMDFLTSDQKEYHEHFLLSSDDYSVIMLVDENNNSKTIFPAFRKLKVSDQK